MGGAFQAFVQYDHGLISWHTILTLGRPGGVGTPLAFSPVTFLMIPTAKIASSYLILGTGDTFWHM